MLDDNFEMVGEKKMISLPFFFSTLGQGTLRGWIE